MKNIIEKEEHQEISKTMYKIIDNEEHHTNHRKIIQKKEINENSEHQEIKDKSANEEHQENRRK